MPGHCPACDGLGYIDSIDIGHRYQIQHCKDCLHRWEYLFDGDGRVVGVTRLDEAGQPLTRSRIRVEPRVAEDDDDPAPIEPRIELPDDHSGEVLDLPRRPRSSTSPSPRSSARPTGCARPASADPARAQAPAAAMAPQTRSGVQGMSTWRTPSGASASHTARLHRGRGPDGAGLADPLGSERVERRRRLHR